MTKGIKRREFMRTGAVAGLTLAGTKSSVLQFPNILIQNNVKPIVIASANGNHFKNGGDMTAVHKAFTMMTGGSDVLEAVIAGVNIVELDPLDDSVGYGGLPNADGIVQLDSSCMHSKVCGLHPWWRKRCWITPIITWWSEKARKPLPATWVSRLKMI